MIKLIAQLLGSIALFAESFFRKAVTAYPGWSKLTHLQRRIRIKWIRRAIAFIILISFVIFSARMLESSPIIGRTLFGLSVFFMGFYFILLTSGMLKTNMTRYFLFLIIFFAGLLIYNTRPIVIGQNITNEVLAISNANSVITSFLSTRSESNVEILRHWQYAIFYVGLHAVRCIFMVALVMSLWGRKFFNDWFNFVSPEKNKYVFWCDNPDKEIMKLAENINKNTDYVDILLIIPEEKLNKTLERETFKYASANGFLLDIVDYLKIKNYHTKAPCHFFITEDQHWNIQMAQEFVEHIPAGKNSVKPQVYVCVSDGEIYNFFIQWADQAKKNVDIRLINLRELAARKLVTDYPMLYASGIEFDKNTAVVSGKFSLLLIGFGRLGRQVLKHVICDSQFIGASFSADIIASNEAEQDLYSRHYNEAIRHYNIRLNCFDVLTKEFYEWAKRNLAKYNRIVLCLGKDEINIEVSELLIKIGKEKQIPMSGKIFTHVTNETTCKYGKRISLSYTFFGRLSSIYNMKMVMNSNAEIIAKAMNYVWECEYSNEPEKLDKNQLWESSPIFKRESSRASAMGVQNTLRLLGFELTNDMSKPDASQELEKILNSPVLETLGRMEHLRWNAFHYMCGVRKWKQEDITYESAEPSFKANQIAPRNRHAALTDFDKLPEIDEKMYGFMKIWNSENPDKPQMRKSDLQEFDRLFVKNIPKFIAEAGMRITKNERA